MTNLRPLTTAGKAGLPALGSFLNDSVPFLAALKPFLGNLDPVINYIDDYRRELAGFFANGTASSQAVASGLISGSKIVHYVRLVEPDQPRGARHVPDASLLGPLQPVSEAGRLQRPALRPAGIRQLPLYRQSTPDRQPDADDRN